MKLKIDNQNTNPLNLARKIGYTIPRYCSEKEISFIKCISRNPYPRFHIYLKEEKNQYIINLHLDQKKPSYSGSHSHNAEYNGEVVEKEAQRIKNIIENNE